MSVHLAVGLSLLVGKDNTVLELKPPLQQGKDMLTDPIREVETDVYKRIFLCCVASSSLALPGVFGSYVARNVHVVYLEDPFISDVGRMRTSSPKGKRYAY